MISRDFSFKVYVRTTRSVPRDDNKLQQIMKMLIDKRMTKSELRQRSGISTASIAKLGKGANITTDVLVKICETLDCDITDIMELERTQHPKG